MGFMKVKIVKKLLNFFETDDSGDDDRQLTGALKNVMVYIINMKLWEKWLETWLTFCSLTLSPLVILAGLPL